MSAGGALSGELDKWPGKSWLFKMAKHELCSANWPYKKVPWLGTCHKTHDSASKGIAELTAREFRDLEEALRNDGDDCIKFEKVPGGFKSEVYRWSCMVETLSPLQVSYLARSPSRGVQSSMESTLAYFSRSTSWGTI